MRYLYLFMILLCHSPVYAIPEFDPAQSSFLVISDIHLNIHTQHAMEFAPKDATISNDLDIATYVQLVDKIKASIQSGELAKPEFILLLGDLVGHVRFSNEDVVNSERVVLKTLRAAFPDTPVLYDFGNNDSLEKDYGPFRASKSVLGFLSPLAVIKTIWPHGHFLSTGLLCERANTYPCLLERNTTGGYYAAYLKPNLRLIALNSVMFAKKEHGYDNRTKLGQLQWLEQQLREAEAAQEAALLVMHIPPGDNIYKAYFWSDTAFLSNEHSQQFHEIIQAHHGCLTGILAAHTHKDEIKVFENSEHVPLVGVYLNPALSASHGNAPSVRSYVLSPSNHNLGWDLSDYRTYYFTQPDRETIQIQQLYQFKSIYCGKGAQRMNDCLAAVTIDNLSRYLQAGNRNFNERISAPQNIRIVHRLY